ncbi:MAG TPA: hypothetical protein VIC08_13770 [Cellvibrionaceae bacterium]
MSTNGPFKQLSLAGFTAPQSWTGTLFKILPASPEWAELDFQAVWLNRQKLHSFFGEDDCWPPDNLDLEADRADLHWHFQEFQAGRSFAYSLLTLNQKKCLGCLYIYPTASENHDAEAYLWTCTTLTTARKQNVEAEIMAWLQCYWPFSAIAWPGRLIPFACWQAPNYYALNRAFEPTGYRPSG